MEFPGQAADQSVAHGPLPDPAAANRDRAFDPEEPLPQFSLQLGLLAIQLAACARDIREAMNRRLAAEGLVEVDFAVLCLVVAQPNQPVSQTELAVQLPLSPARISRSIDHLRGSGWLEVERDAQDRRRQFVSLTDSGQHHLRNTLKQLSPLLNALMERFPERELSDWTQRVIQLRSALDTPPSIPTASTDPSASLETTETKSPPTQSANNPRKGAA